MKLAAQNKVAGTQHANWETEALILKNIQKPEIPARKFDISRFGGKGDGVTDNKQAFDKAMTFCSERGGGSIIVGAGTYLVNGPIHLKSNINLHLLKGAKILFGTQPEDYLPVVLTSWEGTRVYNYSPLIYGYQIKNSAVTGEGEIDGNGAGAWSEWSNMQKKDKLLTRTMNNENVPLNHRIFGKGHFLRPQLIQFYECSNILVDGIKITNSPFWCLHLVFSDNAVIRNIRYDAQNLNNDGVDVESTKNVLIENVDFDNHDDNVAIKSGRDLEGRTLNVPSENIVVRNCRFGGYNALAVGSEISGGVHDVFAENCTTGGNVIYGIYLKSNLDRGGTVSNIYVRNMNFDKTESAILIDSYYKNEGKCCPTLFSNVFIDQVTCQSTTGFGISLIGSAQLPLENIHISNVTINKAAKPINIVETNHPVFKNILINGKDYSSSSENKNKP